MPCRGWIYGLSLTYPISVYSKNRKLKPDEPNVASALANKASFEIILLVSQSESAPGEAGL